MDEQDIRELELLEDRELEQRRKEKRDHKIDKDDTLYRIKLHYNNSTRIVKAKNAELTKGTFLIVPTQYGPEVGVILGKVTDKDEINAQDELLNLIRVASAEDKSRFFANEKKSLEAHQITIKKIAEHGLQMKLINVHYFHEDSKILFNFTADGRIDFRDLVKDLASIFKTRIELRQIGVRDECRIMHGYGICGRHFCCSDVLGELNPITIKMAKEQNLTLNSLKISGTCGRLLCCLYNEYQTYMEEKKRFPDLGSKIKYENDWLTVTEVNVQASKVKLIDPKNPGERNFYVDADDISYDKQKRSGFYKGEPQ